MNKYVESALGSYESIKADLIGFTRANTDFDLTINDGSYPLIFTFTPSAGQSVRADENGVLGEMKVICSCSGAGVDLGLKCHIQAEVLKKLLSRCQVCAEASLHAYKAGRCADNE